MKIKQDLLQACIDFADKRIQNYKNELELIKESIENNDKAGDDDDDSGNGKLLNDMEKNLQHLFEANKILDILKGISPNVVSDKVGLGSIVKTSVNNFFISVSAGKITADGSDFFAISVHSPIGALLLNKKKGDKVEFNGNTFTITEVI